MNEFLNLVSNTKQYINYLERHYINVQEAFAEFTARIFHKNFKQNEKYTSFLTRTKLDENGNFEVLRAKIQAHDLSKLGKEEFTQYRDNFFPIDEASKLKNKEDFNQAWIHHQEYNAHHWQTRADLGDNIPKKDSFYLICCAIENALDWIAMAYEFNETPLNKYYLDNQNKIRLSDNDRYIIETVYEIMMDSNLKPKNTSKAMERAEALLKHHLSSLTQEQLIALYLQVRWERNMLEDMYVPKGDAEN